MSFLALVIVPADAQDKNKKLPQPKFFETALKLEGVDGGLHGTLTFPAKKKKAPVIVIQAGSGPTDRDGNSLLGIKTDAYKLLAEGFAEAGIATLRTDKRGVGKSTQAGANEGGLSFESYIDDLVAWCALLRKDKRFTSVTIAGHSEGSLVGMVAARKVPVDGFVSIAGTGESVSQTLRKQLAGLPPEQKKLAYEGISRLELGERFPCPPGFEALFRDSVQPFLISWMKYEPAKEIDKLTMPVLVIHGTADSQISINDAKLLSNNAVIIEGMSHTLKQVGEDKEKNRDSYRNPALPIEPRLQSEIIAFVKKLKKK